MRRSHTLLTTFAAVLLALSVGPATLAPVAQAASSSERSSTDLRVLNLRLGDLPAGYTQKLGRYWTNAQRARADQKSVRTYEQAGRLLSYEVQFEGDSLVGLMSLDVTVIAYKDERAAHMSYADNAQSKAVQKAGARSMSVGALGSERRGVTLTRTQQGFALTGDVIVFRRSAYVVAATCGGLSGTYSASTLTRLLQRVDQRILGALAGH